MSNLSTLDYNKVFISHYDKEEPLLRLVIALLLAVNLFATMILNLNVKEQKKGVELLINFDVPFEGKIAQKRENDKVILFLKNVKILASWSKKLHNPFIYQIDVTPHGGGTEIRIYTVEKIKIYAARSKDGFSLLLKLIPPPHTASSQSTKSTHKGSDFSQIALWIAIAIGAVAIIALFVKLLTSRGPRKTKRIVVQNEKTQEFTIKFEKPLDERNKIALISFKGVNYLVLIGNTNVLLGKYQEGEIESHEDFEKAIAAQDLSQEFSQDISQEMQPPKEEQEIFQTIEEYKRKASGEL